MKLTSRGPALGAVTALLVGLGAAPGVAAPDVPPEPGAPGIGDPYYPLDGNGGYDARHYRLDVAYDPPTDMLRGTARINAMAARNLSSFNLDLEGLTVRSVIVDGEQAEWSRDGAELTVVPAHALHAGARFVTVIEYDGVPVLIDDPQLGNGGVFHTDDGAVIIGEPDVAATWFPVNDHPVDKARFTINVTVPTGLEAVSNGVLRGQETDGANTTWRWRAREPMAPYLATATVGEFNLTTYTADGIRYIDAVDPDLYDPPAVPPTGEQFAIAQKATEGPSYKRLMRTITVPADDEMTLDFWVTRDTESDWDYLFVEAHTVGQDDWTTLADLNGHTSADTGTACPYWLGLHPQLTHYQTADGDTCLPTGTTGQWWAASGASDGAEVWSVDLTTYAGSDVEVSISYASDETVQGPGVFVDDIVVSSGEGSTSFEDDGDTLDGWTAPGAPEGSPPNPNDWIVGTAADTPAGFGEVVDSSFARQPEIIEFLSGVAGPYPFGAAGGIVDDTDQFGYALENQTRPIYSKYFFTDTLNGDFVVVHELAHQWYGDSLAVKRWRHIWLNEGFASYAEWLWSEEQGLETPQELFDFWYDLIPADDPFWQVTIGDPGPGAIFDGSVYIRGAMTLQALRTAVGDDTFFEILPAWAQRKEGGNVSTKEFIQLAEKASGQDLSDLFRTWLFTPGRPEVAERSPAPAVAPSLADGPAAARALLDRLPDKGVSRSHGW